MKHIIVKTIFSISILIGAFVTYSLLNQDEIKIDGSKLEHAIAQHKSWKIMADWNFGSNTPRPTRFQGIAYYEDFGKNFLWIDHGMGSTIPVRVFNGKMDAPTDSPPIVGLPVTDNKAKERIKTDLFTMNPIKALKLAKVSFSKVSSKEFEANYSCLDKIKESYGCQYLKFNLKLNKDGMPETLILTVVHNAKLSDTVSFFYSEYNKVDMVKAEESINFINLLPPDYNKIAEELDLDAVKKQVEELQSDKKLNK